MRVREKLISGDISLDAGIMLNISSNSVAPSTKAYRPLMGNLQSEFHFFIKNQQAKDEKGGLCCIASFLLLISFTHRDTDTFALSFQLLKHHCEPIHHHHNIAPPLPVERENPFWLKVQNMTAT